jgi:hypothetical protein
MRLLSGKTPTWGLCHHATAEVGGPEYDPPHRQLSFCFFFYVGADRRDTDVEVKAPGAEGRIHVMSLVSLL